MELKPNKIRLEEKEEAIRQWKFVLIASAISTPVIMVTILIKIFNLVDNTKPPISVKDFIIFILGYYIISMVFWTIVHETFLVFKGEKLKKYIRKIPFKSMLITSFFLVIIFESIFFIKSENKSIFLGIILFIGVFIISFLILNYILYTFYFFKRGDILEKFSSVFFNITIILSICRLIFNKNFLILPIMVLALLYIIFEVILVPIFTYKAKFGIANILLFIVYLFIAVYVFGP